MPAVPYRSGLLAWLQDWPRPSLLDRWISWLATWCERRRLDAEIDRLLETSPHLIIDTGLMSEDALRDMARAQGLRAGPLVERARYCFFLEAKFL